MIKRTFRDIPIGKVDDEIEHWFSASVGSSNADGWDELLESKRILIVTEAGAGKTYECQSQQEKLWEAGEPAFFLELARLATDDIRTILSFEEESRFDAWLSAQSDIATFFLDSIDELKLTQGSFEGALKRFGKALKGHLGRAKIIVTTRPVAFDVELIKRHLPVPSQAKPQPTGRTFANTVVNEYQTRPRNQQSPPPEQVRIVALCRLSDEDILEFATLNAVPDPLALLEDLKARNALDFARRPQDLIELCVDWCNENRIRSHREQVSANIRVKLKPREHRLEPAELAVNKAIEGASRLALAMLVTGNLTIWHSVEAAVSEDGSGLDPSRILADWTSAERKALLERPLFGFASYGRVRFHHRSVLEFLASERLKRKIDEGLSVRSLKRLLFASAEGRQIVKPKMRPIVGWLALHLDWVFQFACENDPIILLNDGDPESLSLRRREQVLRAFAKRYGTGGWRGIRLPDVQLHRFATRDLGEEIERIWSNPIENPEVKEVLLELISAGRIERGRGWRKNKTASISLGNSLSEQKLPPSQICSMKRASEASVTHVSNLAAMSFR